MSNLWIAFLGALLLVTVDSIKILRRENNQNKQTAGGYQGTYFDHNDGYRGKLTRYHLPYKGRWGYGHPRSGKRCPRDENTCYRSPGCGWCIDYYYNGKCLPGNVWGPKNPYQPCVRWFYLGPRQAAINKLSPKYLPHEYLPRHWWARYDRNPWANRPLAWKGAGLVFSP